MSEPLDDDALSLRNVKPTEPTFERVYGYLYFLDFLPVILQDAIAQKQDEAGHPRCVIEAAIQYLFVPAQIDITMDNYHYRWKSGTEPANRGLIADPVAFCKAHSVSGRGMHMTPSEWTRYAIQTTKLMLSDPEFQFDASYVPRPDQPSIAVEFGATHVSSLPSSTVPEPKVLYTIINDGFNSHHIVIDPKSHSLMVFQKRGGVDPIDIVFALSKIQEVARRTREACAPRRRLRWSRGSTATFRATQTRRASYLTRPPDASSRAWPRARAPERQAQRTERDNRTSTRHGGPGRGAKEGRRHDEGCLKSTLHE